MGKKKEVLLLPAPKEQLLLMAPKVEKTEEPKIVFDKNHKAIDYKGRGFNTLEEAFAFVETKYFKNLGQADQDEFIKWLY